MSTSPTIFQSSDLNRRGRAVLDAARDGLARIRDTDGLGLVVTTEEAYEDMLEHAEGMRQMAAATASFITIDRAVDHDGRAPSLAELGAWTWARHLPADDAREFVRDVGDALYASCQEGSMGPLAATLAEWRATAEALADPVSRETLLGEWSPRDYVETDRPAESAPEPRAGATG